MAPKAEEYNEDELQPPQWLDSAFFTQVLQNCEQNASDVVLKSFKLTPATVKGDHYASIMFRALTEYRLGDVEKSKSMIIKTMPEVEGTKKDMLEKFDIFEIEIGMYTQVLPRFEKQLRDIGDNTTLKAPVLYHALSPHKLIVFEDIVPLGYNVMRGRFANEDEVKAAYAKLAKWHAISYKIIKEEPHYFDEYRHSFFSQDSIRENPFFMNGTKTFLEFVQKTPELQEYLPTFEKLLEKVDLLDEAVASYNEYRVAPVDNAYYVLNHGDFHSKNMMYKHNPDTGKFEDVMLLDYQFSHVGPITSDLVYSIFMLLDDKLRPRTAEFLHYYFTIFKETLEKIGYDGPLPRLVKFREHLFRHRYTELLMMMLFLPMWPKFCRGDLSPDLLITDKEYTLKIYDKEYLDELLRIIPNYLHLGYLDV
uniref:CHK kinase-like domain-containing protein n=3 Tax=Bactrocera latifrons TaxID=174628 RepID=A0A0K8WD40_BACLA